MTVGSSGQPPAAAASTRQTGAEACRAVRCAIDLSREDQGSATAVCPTCGTARTGSFRYCRSCAFDFDAAASDAPSFAAAVQALSPGAPAGPPNSATNDAPQQPAGEVIVVQVRQLKLLAWVIAGGLIGAMLAGALVVPFFGANGVALGSLAGIATILVSGWIGMRLGVAALGR